MIKIFLLISSIGLATLTTLLLHVDAVWKIAVGIVGFSLAYLLLAALIFFGILIAFGLKVKKGVPAKKYSKVYHRLYSGYQIFALSFFGVKLTVNGLDKIPQDTNFFLVQNHRSNLDPMFTDAILRKYPLIFVAKESLFRLPFFGKIISHIGYIKLTRKSGMDDAAEMVRALRWLKSGEVSLGIYPEGTRNKTYPDPLLLDFKEGTFALAKKAKKPIVITAMHGTEKVNNHLLTGVHKVQFDVVEVIRPEDYENLSAEELSSKVKEILEKALLNPSTNNEKTRLY